MMASRWLWVVLGMFFVVSAGCREAPVATQTVVLIDAPESVRSAIANVRFTVQREPDYSGQLPWTYDTGTPPWPVKLVIVPPHKDEAAQFRLTVEAFDQQNTAPLIVRLITGFVHHQQHYASLVLDSECFAARAATDCTEQQSCSVGACVDASVVASELPTESDVTPGTAEGTDVLISTYGDATDPSVAGAGRNSGSTGPDNAAQPDASVGSGDTGSGNSQSGTGPIAPSPSSSGADVAGAEANAVDPPANAAGGGSMSQGAAGRAGAGTTPSDPCAGACSGGEVCVDGICQVSCTPGTTNCGGACRNLKSDADNCGGCGRLCPDNATCVAAQCKVTCASGQTECSGECHDLTSDNANCGKCDAVCGAGYACRSGSCKLSCSTGSTECSGTCLNLQSDAANCGACGNRCGASQVCSNGACVTSCTAGFTNCSDSCVDLNADVQHCGACGKSCVAGEQCYMGSCSLVCSNGLVNCAGSCRETSSDAANCGSCGKTCKANESCRSNTCVVTSDDPNTPGDDRPGYVECTAPSELRSCNDTTAGPYCCYTPIGNNSYGVETCDGPEDCGSSAPWCQRGKYGASCSPYDQPAASVVRCHVSSDCPSGYPTCKGGGCSS